jgi:hypothetical protein
MSGLLNNSLFLSTAAAAGGYQVSRSLRFNSSDSGFLSRTPAVAGNRTTWTWAGWLKRSGTSRDVLLAQWSGLGFAFEIDSSSRIDAYDYTSGYDWHLISTPVYRDPSAWYHIVFAYDTTQATASNRIKLYINGAQVTTFSTETYPSPSYAGYVNTASAHEIGGAFGVYLDGYLADVHFIDGQALTPSSFTEVSATTGQLIPIAYTGGYGTGTTVATATGALPIFNTTDTYGFVKGSGTRTDSNSASIVLALPMDGTNGGTSFGDQSAVIKGSGSAKTVTVNGNTNTSTAVSKFYGSSGYFDGTGDYLTIPDSTDFDLTGGDFTIELWVYINSIPSSTYVSFVGQSPTGSDGNWWFGTLSTDYYPRFGINGSTPLTASTSMRTSSWNHLAAVKSGSTTTLYLNGVSIVSGTGSYVNNSPQSLYINYINSAAAINGYIQDLRIYKGVAKYTSNFTPVNPTNSFYLQFADNSAATAATLGADTSGNGNNWTPNNFSVAGSANYADYISRFTSGENKYNAFDGSISTYVSQDSTDGTGITFTPSPPITVTSLLRFYHTTGAPSTKEYIINGGSAVTTPNSGWVSTSFTGTLSSFVLRDNRGAGYSAALYAIEVDGTILVDYRSVSGNDSLVDTPTSYGTPDTGVGGEVRGNYATLNPLNKASAVTLSNGNLDVVGTSWNWAMTTIAVNSGKWYWEVTHTNGGADNLFCGIAKTTFQNFTYDLNHAVSDSYNLWGYTSYFGNKEGQGSSTSYGATFQTAGDIVGCALDMDAGTITFYKNGVSQGQAFSGITAQVCPVWGGTGSSIGAANFNFGQRAFAYTPPAASRHYAIPTSAPQ